MKKYYYFFLIVFCDSMFCQITENIDSAYRHLKEQFDQFHLESYVYSDDNAGGNIFIPSLFEGDININISQSHNEDAISGRSCTKIIFPLNTPGSYSAIRYVYPENNIGNLQGFDMAKATELTFYAKGSGTVEFHVGGTNRRPFYSDTLPFVDGLDIRSTGFIDLPNTWQKYSIDLTDNRFWVYIDSTAGLNNRYIEPKYMAHYNYFDFNYGADNGHGGTCMRVFWFGGNSRWAGIFLFPPEGDWSGTQGYNLTGITKIRFKAKNSSGGNVKFLFGKSGDSSGHLTNTMTLSTDWEWYEWTLPSDSNYSDIVGGFGFFFGGDIGTPDSSYTYIDSVYYEGIELAGDLSNLICGFRVSASEALNEDTVTVYLDEIKYNKDRTGEPRFCQSYVCLNDSLDITQKNSAHVYDNALQLISNLALFKERQNSFYLNNARLIGDAFVYALDHDRYFTDDRLRNVYWSGELVHYDGSVKMPGWWDEDTKTWNEDIYFVSTTTGNMAWAGLALISLYEITKDSEYLDASLRLAQWCIDSVQTDSGYTGGFEGWGPEGQEKQTWKSTEHNIDLYAQFTRLFSITKDSIYYNAAQIARDFVISMWNSTDNHFWTGTLSDGITIDTNYYRIPLDIQAWYLMAFNDDTSQYTNAMDWGYQHCYQKNYYSSNYNDPIDGFDFNADIDGIWFEGSSQAALAFKMLDSTNIVDNLLNTIEYVQSNGPINNNKGIPSADHHSISTGFDWEYHNRLHTGATNWYIFAALGYNPYYTNIDCEIQQEFDTLEICEGDSVLIYEDYYKSSGTFYDTLYTILGCDSIIVTNLIVHNVDSTEFTRHICLGDSIQIGDSVYRQSGNYVTILHNQYFCDSFVILDLTVNPTHVTNLADTICQSDSVMIGSSAFKTTGNYSVILTNQYGCDSVVNLDLTANPTSETNLTETICQGDSIMIGSSVFKTTGNYSVTLTNLYSCDSVVNLDLTVNPLPYVNIGNDTTITENDSILLSSGNVFISYLWNTYDTTSSIWIVGANIDTGKYYYWLEIKDENNCINSDTILITIIEVANINSLISSGYIRFYPNPTNDFLNIEINGIKEKMQIDIISQDGMIIFSKNYKEGLNIIDALDLNEFKSGWYIIKILTVDEVRTNKFLLIK